MCISVVLETSMHMSALTFKVNWPMTRSAAHEWFFFYRSEVLRLHYSPRIAKPSFAVIHFPVLESGAQRRSQKSNRPCSKASPRGRSRAYASNSAKFAPLACHSSTPPFGDDLGQLGNQGFGHGRKVKMPAHQRLVPSSTFGASTAHYSGAPSMQISPVRGIFIEFVPPLPPVLGPLLRAV